MLIKILPIKLNFWLLFRLYGLHEQWRWFWCQISIIITKYQSLVSLFNVHWESDSRKEINDGDKQLLALQNNSCTLQLAVDQ